MIEITGDFWSHLDQNRDIYDAICCTTNTVVKLNGELVMGAGIAKDFANEYKWLPKHWGERLEQHPNKYSSKIRSTLLVTLMKVKPHLVFLQTKFHWKDPSNISTIHDSMNQLYEFANTVGWKKILLPRPGCKNGGLSWKDEVQPLLKGWDDRFVIINNGT